MNTCLASLPAHTGVGLRLPHIRQVLSEHPDVPWFEVHSENYFGGGANLAALRQVRADYPVSLHGIGLGLGSVAGPDAAHLDALAKLVEHIQPAAVSEHVCWNRGADAVFNDLLPLPFTKEALDLMVCRVDALQERLGRRVLLENVSAYVAYTIDRIPEGEFLAELARRSGCGLLLDVNNLYVSERNLGRSARAAIDALPAGCIGEIHVAGFDTREDGLLIDTHSGPVCADVMDLLEHALRRFGPLPVLLEWDTRLPAFDTLHAERGRVAQRAGAVVEMAGLDHV